MTKFSNLFRLLSWKSAMQKHSDWFDKNEPAQARFEENEDWLEELEDRVVILEEKIEKLTAAIERTKL
jgi:predicted nuclease with TOPRIM domain